MKKIAMTAFAFASALAAMASAPETRFVKVASTNDVLSLLSIPEWRRGSDTNGVTFTVCVGIAIVSLHGGDTEIKVPLSRDLEFDSDGRLVRASGISLIKRLIHADTATGELLHLVGPMESSAIIEEMRRKRQEKIEAELAARMKSEKESGQRARRESPSSTRPAFGTRRTPGRPTPQSPSAKPSCGGR